ncbi:MAG: hypothetical protein P9L94_16205 [Candidatus Hinthialibacter antarcticus]|nr:hypothetical protein [Candidatus Hinthialibacter antarcticus]
MDPRLSQLLVLQETLSEQREIESEYDIIPKRRQEIEGLFGALEDAVEAAKTKIQECETEQKTRELDLSSNQDKRVKKEAQLLSIKNKKEYDATLGEIEALDKKNQRIETRMLELMESVEKANKTIEEKTAELDLKKSQFSGELGALEDRASEMNSSIEEAKSASQEVVDKVNPSLYQRFIRVFNSRNGLAVVPANNGHCGGCSVRLTPRIIQLVKRGQDVVQCEACHRFLVWESDELIDDDQALL